MFIYDTFWFYLTCNLTATEIDINGTVYTVDVFLSEDLERNCMSVLMMKRPGPSTPAPTYNPYKELPVTDQYVLARECLNVNTTGFYDVPYVPIDWQDFNITVSFSGKVVDSLGTWYSAQGGYSDLIWTGMCCPSLQTPTLF